jgi:Spy/CpxP family protein refolding chaperone
VTRVWWAMLVMAACAWAQPPGGPGSGPGGPPDGGPPQRGGGPPPNGRRGPGGPPPGARQNGPGGRWWTDAKEVQKLGLSEDQQKKIEAEFQQRRLKLIDLSAGVEKQEAMLEPLLEVDQPDEKKVLAQIDKVAQARAELEKENAAMLLGFRRVLTVEQWKKLQAEGPQGFNGSGRQAP